MWEPRNGLRPARNPRDDLRSRRERYYPPPRGKKRAAAGVVGIVVGMMLMHAVGYSGVEIGAVLLAGSLLAKYLSDFDEPPSVPLAKQVWYRPF